MACGSATGRTASLEMSDRTLSQVVYPAKRLVEADLSRALLAGDPLRVVVQLEWLGQATLDGTGKRGKYEGKRISLRR